MPAAKLSKNIIRQDRPNVTVEDDPKDPSRRPKKKVKKTYGMPSTHSTSIGFYMAYIILSLPPFSSPSTTISGMRRALTVSGPTGGLMALMTLVWGSLIMWSRVRIGYHTLAQVLVGAAIGLSGGLAWRWMWDNKVVGLGSWEGVLQGWIDRAFGMVGL